MKTLISITTMLFMTSTVWAFEGVSFTQDRIDHQILQAAVNHDEKAASLEKVPDEFSEKRGEMQRVYSLMQDEAARIFPVFIGALEGQGAGARFSNQELQEICSEVKAKLAYPHSCLHAAQVAAGLNKEEVQNLQERRKKHMQIYMARINSLENAAAKTGVASR